MNPWMVGAAQRRERTGVDDRGKDSGEDLQHLVRRRLDQLKKQGLSLAALVQRATREGHSLDKTQLSKYSDAARPVRQVPYPAALFALAAALDVHVEEVADAALRSTGVPVRVRRYDRRNDRATVRGICPPCTPRKEGFEEFVVMLPHADVTQTELDELVTAVRTISARQMARREYSGDGGAHGEA